MILQNYDYKVVAMRLRVATCGQYLVRRTALYCPRTMILQYHGLKELKELVHPLQRVNPGPCLETYVPCHNWRTMILQKCDYKVVAM